MEPEEDLTKDMEDPTPVPNMEEVKLPKNGESHFLKSLFLFVFPNLYILPILQSVHNTNPNPNTVLALMLSIFHFLVGSKPEERQ